MLSRLLHHTVPGPRPAVERVRVSPWGAAWLALGMALLGVSSSTAAAPAERPNIIFMMADDQGYADLGCYGSTSIVTPHIDRLAQQGTRFTDCYSGSAVCAPTRCVLMTGLHTGHCRRRDNTATAHQDDFPDRPLVPLSADDLTIASVLQKAGYATGGFGKWGLGNPGTTGVPAEHGFDTFLGYLDQVHAHSYYTDHLVREDGQSVPHDPKTYSHYTIMDAALDFVRQHRDGPFFLYLPVCPPHGDYQIPADDPATQHYRDKPWPQQVKNYAAMVTRIDLDVQRLCQLLDELELADNTIVFYTSDNGPNPTFAQHLDSGGPLRGIKRQLYEGGIRCPMIVRWPGQVPAGRTSDTIWSQVDFFATACDLAGVDVPAGLDSQSMLPTLRDQSQPPRGPLYWEIHHPFHQAARQGPWKALRWGTEQPIQLYHLPSDIAEQHDVADQHPDIVAELTAFLDAQHRPSRYWPAVAKTNPPRNK